MSVYSKAKVSEKAYLLVQARGQLRIAVDALREATSNVSCVHGQEGSEFLRKLLVDALHADDVLLSKLDIGGGK